MQKWCTCEGIVSFLFHLEPMKIQENLVSHTNSIIRHIPLGVFIKGRSAMLLMCGNQSSQYKMIIFFVFSSITILIHTLAVLEYSMKDLISCFSSSISKCKDWAWPKPVRVWKMVFSLFGRFLFGIIEHKEFTS